MNPPDFTTPDTRTVPAARDAPPPPDKPGAKGRMIGQNLSVLLEDNGESSSTPVGNQETSKLEATPEELLHQITRLQEELARRQAEAVQQHLPKLTPVRVPVSPLPLITPVTRISPKRRREEEISFIPRETPAPHHQPTPEPGLDDDFEDEDQPL